MSFRDFILKNIGPFVETCAIGFITLIAVCLIITFVEKVCQWLEKQIWADTLGRGIMVVVGVIVLAILGIGFCLAAFWSVGALVQWVFG